MSYLERYKNFHFSGALANLMDKYVAEKRALGRLFNKQSQMLARLDKMSIEFGLSKTELPKELVDKWIVLQPNECRKNQRYRLSFIKLFAGFMIRLGFVAYMTNVKIATRDDEQFVPYIFTKDELTKMFYEIDHMPTSAYHPRSRYIYPVLYRALYCCGLRANEALNLCVCDVNTESGVLHIREAKHGKSRYVPMSPQMTIRCKTLQTQVHTNSSPEDYFFPNARNNIMQISKAYWVFRGFLRAAKISHGGRGNGPRLHDLRHTFAVHCLQKWVKEGADVKALFPYLSSYLGHSKLGGTQKYLHLTHEAHSGLVQQFQVYVGNIIPVLEVLDEA